MKVRHIVGLLAIAYGLTGSFQATANELDGSSWRVVHIMPTNDSVDVPEDPSKYGLDLQSGGQATMQADCNRGNGSWVSEAAGQLRFGPIASTQAMCPPKSLSQTYLALFEVVRGYVIKDGHLFLTTGAHSPIVEFEPVSAAALAATVLGEDVRTSDATELQEVILTRLFERYAAEQDIEVAPAEMDAYLEALQRGEAEQGLTAEDKLTPEETAEVAAMRRAMARANIRQWKINRALHGQYGGRVIYQQFGPEPLDAYRAFLEQRQSEGAFTIHDPALARSFWRYFTDESIHDFMAPGSADEARAFTTPPWEK